MTKRKIFLLIVIAAVLGFVVGRLTLVPETSVEVKEMVKFVPSTTIIRDTISTERLVPYKTYVTDTVVKYMTQAVDTAAILKDYYLTRRYELDFSHDTIGTFIVDAEVNQNKLVAATSMIQPMVKTITRETTKYRVPLVQFYGMLGTSVNFEVNKMSLGADLRQRYLIGASVIRYNDNYNYTVDFGVKF